MKFVIVFACLLAIAYANEEANVLKQYSEVNHDSFNYGLDLDNHISLEQHGKLKDEKTFVVEGFYEFVTKDGKHVKVTYQADEYGYHPKTEYLK